MNVYSEASLITGLPKEIIRKVYNSYWRVVREHFSSLPLKEDITEEEFNSLKPSINISSIGKLYVTYDRQKGMRNAYNKYIKSKKSKQ